MDESGTFGKDIRICNVEAESNLSDLLRFYITYAYGNPFPPKTQTASQQEIDCCSKLIRTLEADSRFDWQVHLLTPANQFLVSREFSAFETRESLEVLHKARERISIASQYLFRGLPTDAKQDRGLELTVNPRPDQTWKAAVGGWWNTGEGWVNRHVQYLREQRRPDKFTKALAYLTICHDERGEFDGPCNWYIDGGAPMTFWSPTLAEHHHRYVHGITNGDETHPFVTAADRICRVFPKLNGIPFSSPHVAHVKFEGVIEKMDTHRKQFKETVISSNFQNMILVEKESFANELAIALPSAWAALQPKEQHIFPSLVRPNDVIDFAEQHKGVAGQTLMVVSNRSDAIKKSFPKAQMLSPPDAWAMVKNELRRLQSVAREAGFPQTHQSRVVGRIQGFIETWEKKAASTPGKPWGSNPPTKDVR